jgi:NADH-quinone oxidoreductase subunit M
MLLVLIIGSIFVLILPKRSKTMIKLTAIAFSLIPLVLSLYMFMEFDRGITDFQYMENGTEGHSWISPIGVRYIVGVDGISMPLVFLTTLLTTLSLIYSWDEERRTKEYFALMLVMEIGVLGVFTSLDYFIFYVFWELVLIPMYFFIGVWGGPRKHYAAIKFFIYTHVASVIMLMGILALFFKTYETTGDYTFSMIEIAEVAPSFDLVFQGVVFAALFFGFATKMPAVPVHTWLPDAHVEAPTAGSVLLAGVLLKMGGYGLIRIGVNTLPEVLKTSYVVGGWELQPTYVLIAVIGVISIVYAAMVCLAQRDLKRLVAYSSVSHMGIVMLGVATMTEVGISGAVFQMFNHGLITAVLFMMAGSIHHHTGTRDIPTLGGLSRKIPVAASVLLVGSLASLGLPGLCSFISEFMCFYATYETFGNWVWIPVVGVVITAAYYLWACQRAIFGPYKPSIEEKFGKIHDLSWYEVVPLAILIALIAFFGIWPHGILEMTNPPSALLAGLMGGGGH